MIEYLSDTFSKQISLSSEIPSKNLEVEFEAHASDNQGSQPKPAIQEAQKMIGESMPDDINVGDRAQFVIAQNQPGMEGFIITSDVVPMEEQSPVKFPAYPTYRISATELFGPGARSISPTDQIMEFYNQMMNAEGANDEDRIPSPPQNGRCNNYFVMNGVKERRSFRRGKNGKVKGEKRSGRGEKRSRSAMERDCADGECGELVNFTKTPPVNAVKPAFQVRFVQLVVPEADQNNVVAEDGGSSNEEDTNVVDSSSKKVCGSDRPSLDFERMQQMNSESSITQWEMLESDHGGELSVCY